MTNVSCRHAEQQRLIDVSLAKAFVSGHSTECPATLQWAIRVLVDGQIMLMIGIVGRIQLHGQNAQCLKDRHCFGSIRLLQDLHLVHVESFHTWLRSTGGLFAPRDEGNCKALCMASWWAEVELGHVLQRAKPSDSICGSFFGICLRTGDVAHIFRTYLEA